MNNLHEPGNSRFRMVIVLCMTVFSIAACGTATPATETTEAQTQDQTLQITTPEALDTVTVGIFGLSSDAAVFIAIDRGYFRDQGIHVETSQFTALSDMIPALATGQLDVGNANTGAALFNALGTDYGLKIVADNATIEEGRDGSALVLRQELADTIASPADLRGLRIGAVANGGTPTHICLEELLETVGMTSEDVELTQLPFPAMGAALANGAVEGAIIVEPFLSAGLSQGLFVTYRGMGEICAGREVNVQVYSADFAAQTDLARRFAVARLRGARDFNDAFFKNIDRDAIVDILTRYTALTDPALYENLGLTTMNPNGMVSIESLTADLAWYVEHEFVPEGFDVRLGIDTNFAEYAVEVLGVYE
ncbi:MAG: ABC transporter substrate-binding protein [Anaerolineae bacterium]